jgi:hypothetical protein
MFESSAPIALVSGSTWIESRDDPVRTIVGAAAVMVVMDLSPC